MPYLCTRKQEIKTITTNKVIKHLEDAEWSSW